MFQKKNHKRIFLYVSKSNRKYVSHPPLLAGYGINEMNLRRARAEQKSIHKANTHKNVCTKEHNNGKTKESVKRNKVLAFMMHFPIRYV